MSAIVKVKHVDLREAVLTMTVGEFDGWVDWKLFDVIGTHEGARLFRKADRKAYDNMTTRLEEAEPCATGYVQWDGCTQVDLSMHECDYTGLRRLTDNVARAYVECVDWMMELRPDRGVEEYVLEDIIEGGGRAG